MCVVIYVHVVRCVVRCYGVLVVWSGVVGYYWFDCVVCWFVGYGVGYLLCFDWYCWFGVD